MDRRHFLVSVSAISVSLTGCTSGGPTSTTTEVESTRATTKGAESTRASTQPARNTTTIDKPSKQVTKEFIRYSVEGDIEPIRDLLHSDGPLSEQDDDHFVSGDSNMAIASLSVEVVGEREGIRRTVTDVTVSRDGEETTSETGLELRLENGEWKVYQGFNPNRTTTTTEQTTTEQEMTIEQLVADVEPADSFSARIEHQEYSATFYEPNDVTNIKVFDNNIRQLFLSLSEQSAQEIENGVTENLSQNEFEQAEVVHYLDGEEFLSFQITEFLAKDFFNGNWIESSGLQLTFTDEKKAKKIVATILDKRGNST